MNATLIAHSLRTGTRPSCESLRYRATITIDFEGCDEVEVQAGKAAIEAAFTAIQRLSERAQLDFKRRRPRTRPRPGAPGPMIEAYADD